MTSLRFHFRWTNLVVSIMLYPDGNWFPSIFESECAIFFGRTACCLNYQQCIGTLNAKRLLNLLESRSEAFELLHLSGYLRVFAKSWVLFRLEPLLIRLNSHICKHETNWSLFKLLKGTSRTFYFHSGASCTTWIACIEWMINCWISKS